MTIQYYLDLQLEQSRIFSIIQYNRKLSLEYGFNFLAEPAFQ